MPLEDALLMLSRDFNGYLSKLRCGSEQPSLNFLLHLISDGKNLSQGELDRVVQHLQGRKDQLASTSGAAEQQPAQFSTGHPSGSLDDNKERVQAQPTSSAADLQKKILSILGGGSNPSAPVTSTSANIGAQSLISEKPVSLLGAGPASTKIPVLGDVQVSVSSSVPAVSQPGLMGQATAEAAKPQADLQKTLNSLLQNPDALKNIMPKQQQPLLANPGMNLGDDGHNFQDGGGSSVSQPPSIGSYGNGYGGGSYQAMVSTKPKAATPDATAEAQGGIQPMFGGQPSQQRVASARIYGSRGLLDAPKSFDFQN